MSVEQLKAKLSEAREKYNQIVAATQAQGENVKEIEQRIKVLNQMVDKAKQSKTNLHSEIERLAKEKKNKTKQLQRASDTKCQLLAEEIAKVEKDAEEKEQIYLALQTRYKILREHWEHKENDFLSKIYELEQTYSQIKAKTNEVIGRIQSMSPSRRPGLLFNSVPDVFPDFNLFAQPNIEEFNSSGSGDATFELELEDEDQDDDDLPELKKHIITDIDPDYESFNYAFKNKLDSFKNSMIHQPIPIVNNGNGTNSPFNFALGGNSLFNSPGLFSTTSNFGSQENRFVEEEDEDALIGEITNIDEEDEEEEDKTSFLMNNLQNNNNNNSNNSFQESIDAFFQQQNNNELLNHFKENRHVNNLKEKVSQLSLKERKLTLEKLKLECRLLQHQRDDLLSEMQKPKPS